MDILSAQTHRIDFSARSVSIVVLALVILAIDGMDLQFLALSAPSIIAEWHVGPAAFGIPLSAALAGMAVGSAIGGLLGDRFGRKVTLILSIMAFGLATGLAGWSGNIWSLACLRLIGGIGFGAASPNALALANEWSPHDRRPQVAALMAAGQPLGFVLIAYLGLCLLPIFGWRTSFFLLGGVTILLGLAATQILKESRQFLAKSGRSGDRMVSVHEPDERSVWQPEWRWFTIAACLAFALYCVVVYCLSGWVPVLLRTLGMSFERSAMGLLLMSICALVGTVASGPILSRIGSRLMIALSAGAGIGCCLLLMILCSGIVGAMPRDVYILALIAALGWVIGLIAGTLYGLVTIIYPVRLRATGVGLSLTAAKVSGVGATLLGGVVLAPGGGGPLLLFAIFSAALAGTIISVLSMARQIEPRARHRRV